MEPHSPPRKHAKGAAQCSVSGCDRPHANKGLCGAHFLQSLSGAKRPLRIAPPP